MQLVSALKSPTLHFLGNSNTAKARMARTGYFRAISKIARQERAKLYIPVSAPTTAIYDALTQDVLPKDCVCWTLPPHLTGLLDDKTAFTDLCNKVSRCVFSWLACIKGCLAAKTRACIGMQVITQEHVFSEATNILLHEVLA